MASARNLLSAGCLLLAIGSRLAGETGARYLIITYDSYYSALQPLAEWKTAKGMRAKVVKMSEAGSSATAIRSYIVNAYNTWTVKPEYVLVVGSPRLLPPSRMSSDDSYADMTGDYKIELSIGRFYATSLAECSLMVAKTLAYEKTPFASGDSDWMLKGQTIVHEDQPQDQYYQPDCRYVRGLWRSASYLVAESLRDDYSSSTDVRNGIHDGRGFVVYRGQCVSEWEPPFDQVQPLTLDNTNRTPIVVSGSCQTVDLSQYNQTMYADQFVRAGAVRAPRGGVAYFGTSELGSGISLERGIATRSFFSAIFNEGRYKLGDACRRAKFVLDSVVHDVTRYEEWNLLGDPELPVWTARPAGLAASYDSVIPQGISDFRVHVSEGEGFKGSRVQGFKPTPRPLVPLPGAVVCVMMDSTVYDTARTDANGDAVITIHPAHLGHLRVTITARNCLPYEDSARVAPLNTPYLVILRNRVDDSQGGNGDGLVNPGESVRLSLTLRNIGDSSAAQVRASLAAGDTWSSVTDTLQDFGDVAVQDSAVSPGAYLLQVAPGCTNGLALSYALHIRDGHGRAWQGAFSVPVVAPEVTINSVTVFDPAPGGNGDGRLGRGEGVRLLLSLRNVGGAGLGQASAKLRTTNGYVAIDDSTGSFGSIASGETRFDSSDEFGLTASPALPGSKITFNLVIRGNTGSCSYSRTRQFDLLPAQMPGRVGPDPYGYYCYPDADTGSGRAPVYSWLELAPPGPGQLISGITNSDAGLDTLRLPFSFLCYGACFDTVTVASNGFLAFGTTSYRWGSNRRLPIDSIPISLAPFWDDLNLDKSQNGHGNAYQYYDTSNHRWIMEFYQVAHYDSSTHYETFQLVLCDPAFYPTPSGDGEALFIYQTVTNPNSATVGMQQLGTGTGLQYEYDGSYHTNAVPISARRVLRFTTLAPRAAPREWLTLKAVGLNDSIGGNGNGIADPGEEIRLALSLLNQGDSGAGSVTGVLRALDSDARISDSSAGFGVIPVDSLGANAAHPYVLTIADDPTDTVAQLELVVSTNGRLGAIYFDLPLAHRVGINQARAKLPERLELAAHPNPARGLVHLVLSLPQPGRVDLAAFDASGRRVRTLLQGMQARGKHALAFDGRDESGRTLAGGVYFLRLSARTSGSGSVASPLLLVRKIELLR